MTLMGDVAGHSVRVRGVRPIAGSDLMLLGSGRRVAFDHLEDGFEVHPADNVPASDGCVVRNLTSSPVVRPGIFTASTALAQ